MFKKCFFIVQTQFYDFKRLYMHHPKYTMYSFTILLHMENQDVVSKDN